MEKPTKQQGLTSININDSNEASAINKYLNTNHSQCHRALSKLLNLRTTEPIGKKTTSLQFNADFTEENHNVKPTTNIMQRINYSALVNEENTEQINSANKKIYAILKNTIDLTKNYSQGRSGRPSTNLTYSLSPLEEALGILSAKENKSMYDLENIKTIKSRIRRLKICNKNAVNNSKNYRNRINGKSNNIEGPRNETSNQNTVHHSIIDLISSDSKSEQERMEHETNPSLPNTKNNTLEDDQPCNLTIIKKPIPIRPKAPSSTLLSTNSHPYTLNTNIQPNTNAAFNNQFDLNSQYPIATQQNDSLTNQKLSLSESKTQEVKKIEKKVDFAQISTWF